MRQIIICFVAAFAVATLGTRFFPGKTAVATPAVAATQPAQAEKAQTEKARAPVGSRKVSLYKSYNGHYQAQVEVEGINIGFLVDTGASMIALRQSDAAKIGVRPEAKQYTASVSTANGVVRAAPVTLKRVALGSISVDNVKALVLPDTALGTNLLGMSFLDQVSWSQKGGNLVLEQ